MENSIKGAELGVYPKDACSPGRASGAGKYGEHGGDSKIKSSYSDAIGER